MNLPKIFAEEMQRILGEDADAFFASYEIPSNEGLRINTGKITQADELKNGFFQIESLPWIPNGFRYTEGMPSKDPYYYAGLYYLQEPSAMTPASRLDVEPGDYVLDLCAAPGGKATELGAKLQGKGVLVANDISNSRAKALLKNIEKAGIPNVYVTSEEPQRLLEQFPEWFDKILVDAPCSGEGMFRRDPAMIHSWEERGPAYYHEIQKTLILQAADMLRPGGKLLYSTCTFSEMENEGTISWLLSMRPQMKLIPCVSYEGFSKGRAGLDDCVRIYPHKMSGEGHFMALLTKEGEAKQRGKAEISSKIPKEAKEFLKDCNLPYLSDHQNYFMIEDRIYLLPDCGQLSKKLRYLRTGLLLGTIKKDRFEPSQALAMAMMAKDYPYRICLSHDDERIVRYLKGETLDFADQELVSKSGWMLVCVENFPLGWGKPAKNRLKNKYSAGWRML